VVELQDDGRGIDPERIFRKAVEKGIVAPEAVLTRHEILMLIMAPGFSTAEKITAVSGRGVGMDVVKRNIERLRGSIEIESEVGRGSTFKIKLPLTMAIIDGLVVRVGTDRFI
jgi:two-component system, chemotaxis family, sensor kinase CheA